jgi:hypothetical protein
MCPPGAPVFSRSAGGREGGALMTGLTVRDTLPDRQSGRGWPERSSAPGVYLAGTRAPMPAPRGAGRRVGDQARCMRGPSEVNLRPRQAHAARLSVSLRDAGLDYACRRAGVPCSAVPAWNPTAQPGRRAGPHAWPARTSSQAQRGLAEIGLARSNSRRRPEHRQPGPPGDEPGDDQPRGR